ncbi:MAG: tRNA 2-thiouridine(34) synthase MnmA [Bacillota bacterium]|nr:tRNA 2-thiouridine(34) synthase MnmA [Bacillota bacterium]
MSKGRVLVAMSGGVDSSVTAFLLKEQGYECIGCTMKLFDNDDIGISDTHACSNMADVEDARKIAAKLDMPHYLVDFSKDFKEKIIDKFVSSYEMGITPNPCVDCNKNMKFKMLYDKARELNCDFVATGHYARITNDGDSFQLRKAVDPSKDQSYVLFNMTQDQLSRTIFPLGGMTKSEAREIAEKNGFVNAHKPDSQDICFVPHGDYAKIVELHSGKGSEPGDFIDGDGNVLGQHRGIIHYTIGQRKGLGISAPHPLYVSEINPDSNTVTLVKNEELFSCELFADNPSWTSGQEPPNGFRCSAKIRYKHREQPATLYIEETAESNSTGLIRLVFDEPQRAITPGQALVIYDGDKVIGGGTIIRGGK